MKKFKSKATKMLSSVIAVIMTLTAFSALTPRNYGRSCIDGNHRCYRRFRLQNTR